MFNIGLKTLDELQTLQLDENLFHRAYELGVKHYHVEGKNGISFDISYSDNNNIVPDNYKAGFEKVGEKEIIPSYKFYDENNDDLIDISYFEEKAYIFFEEVNEYSIVLAKIFLKNNKKVYFTNEKIKWFLEINENLFVVSDFPKVEEDKKINIGQSRGFFIPFDKNFISYEMAFHNTFYLQTLTLKSLKKYKYLKINISPIDGIGIIPVYLSKLNKAFKKYNLEVILDPSNIRYDEQFLKKYFTFNIAPSDMTIDNTIEVKSLTSLMISDIYINNDAYFSYEIFNEKFLSEMEEYREAVFRDKKVLGALIRGTDYITADVTGEGNMTREDEVISLIKDWMKQDKFDMIFLATEDEDIMKKMFLEFKSKVVCVSQERFKKKEFEKGQTIQERELVKYTKEEYKNKVEDTAINYMYALYMLSKCDSIICSGMCNGYRVVENLNANNFTQKYIFNLNK